VDLDARIIERWRPEDGRPEVADEALEWVLPDGVTARLDVRQIFLNVWEEIL